MGGRHGQIGGVRAAALALLVSVAAACGSGSQLVPAPVVPSAPELPVSAPAAPADGTLLFDHDLAGAPELQARVSLIPRLRVAALDRQARSEGPVQWPSTVARDAMSSPFLQYGRQHRFTLPPGMYVTALFDRDGNQAGLAFATEVVAGAPADPPITVTGTWVLTNLEPDTTPPAAGSAPPVGSPAAALLDASQLGVDADLVDAVPVRFRITRASAGDTGASGPAGPLSSPLLEPGQSWNTLVPAGDYRVTAWDENDNQVWGETTASVSDSSDPLSQQSGVTLSQLRDAPPDGDRSRTPPR